MADFTLGNVPVISGTADMPRIGAWTADLYLQTDIAPSPGTTTTLQLRDRLLLCTVVAASADYLSVRCRVVAGRGKLDVVLEPRDYKGYQASEIAQDALSDAGETAGTWDALNVYCAHWVRSQGPCRGALRRLVRLLGQGTGAVDSFDAVEASTIWRVQDDGTVDALVDDFADAGSKFVPLQSWGDDRAVLLSMEDANVRPGKSITAFDATRALDRVLYDIRPSSFTAMCWYY